MSPSKKVLIVGAGSFGQTISIKISQNILESGDEFDKEVLIWVFEEIIDDKKLTDWINNEHRNVKYLPDIILPQNIKASNDLLGLATVADIIVFCLPHKFLPSILKQLQGKVKDSVIAVSLSKGFDFDIDGRPQLISEMINSIVQPSAVAVLMGANVATDVVKGDFVESTLACKDEQAAQTLFSLLNGENFRLQLSTDVSGVELCGALKNVMAMGAGFCDALGLGSSSKAAIIRKGLVEMADLCRLYFPSDFKWETILESCGVADLVASAYGGRNSRCSQEFARRVLRGDTNVRWSDIEDALLGSQKLEGLGTCEALYLSLRSRGLLRDFPLVSRIYEIANLGAHPKTIFKWDSAK